MTITEQARLSSVKPPRRLLAYTEYARASWELGALAYTWPTLLHAPLGDQPVLVLPGLGTSGLSTTPLRHTLRALGHSTHSWGLGVNIGPSRRILIGMRAKVDELADQYGQPITLIGWSLGGIFARRLTRENPSLIRQVITLGSPFKLVGHEQSNAAPLYKAFSHRHIEDLDFPLERADGPLPVPAVALYSRLDGAVPWQVCRDPNPTAENIEVLCSHLGFGHSLPALWAVADRLATGFDSSGARAPFVPPAWLRYAYPSTPAVDNAAPALRRVASA